MYNYNTTANSTDDAQIGRKPISLSSNNLDFVKNLTIHKSMLTSAFIMDNKAISACNSDAVNGLLDKKVSQANRT